MQALRMAFWLGVFTLFAWVLMENKWMLQEASYLTFYFKGFQTNPIPVPMVIAGSALIGTVLVGISTILAQARYRSVIKKQKKQIKVQERELAQMRNLPLADIPTVEESVEEPIQSQMEEEPVENSVEENFAVEVNEVVEPELELESDPAEPEPELYMKNSQTVQE